MQVLALYHTGISSPLQASSLASVAQQGGAHVLFYNREILEPHSDQFRGVIDISRGVAVIYVGSQDEDLVEGLLQYVKKNRNKLIEQWTNARNNLKTG